MRTISRVVSLAGAFFFAGAALMAVRLAVAETLFRKDTAASIRRAIAAQSFAPAAEFEERLAALDPDHAREALHRALADNPRASEAWIALGLSEESSGDAPAAEQSLLDAARVDRLYLPAWTLANFYFRQGNRPAFWPWAARAASLTYDDFRPLFRLADQFEPDPVRMLAHFQDRPRLRPSYLNFLIEENRLDAAQKVAREMSGDRANDPHLIDSADRQLRAGHAAEAIELWNLSSGFAPIEPSKGKILTNGNLARAPLNLGFDWRLGEVDGVAANWRSSELTFAFSGSQPEGCVLLEQTIDLVPGHFRLRFDYRTGAEPAAGVRWALDRTEAPRIEPGEVWKEGAFDLPPARGLAHLKLIYRRDAGTTRTEGQIEIRNLRLEPRS